MHCARQHNTLVNLEDVFNHLWLYTDPVLRSLGEKKQVENPSNSNEIEPQNMSEDDKLFNSFVIPE